jgi:hypothetical protein
VDYDTPTFQATATPLQRGYAEEAIVNGLVEMMGGTLPVIFSHFKACRTEIISKRIVGITATILLLIAMLAWSMTLGEGVNIVSAIPEFSEE